MANNLYAESKEKFTDKIDSVKKEVGLWQERIQTAKKMQDDWSKTSGAQRFIDEYKGDYKIVFHQRNKTVPIPAINEVFSYVQADIATTYNRDPYITCNPKSGTQRGARLWEINLNYWWRELKTKEEIEYEIIDKDLVGFGWHKIGWYTNSVGSSDTLRIDKEGLYSNRLDWKDVLWNVGAMRPPKDCVWMAQRIVMPLNMAKKKYPNAKGLEGSGHPDVDKETFNKSIYKDDIKVLLMYEIWDAESKRVLLIADGLKDKYLDEPKPWPDYLDEFPFQMYWDFLNPGSPRPISAIAPWEAQILEEMMLMGQALNHSKRWNRQLFVRNGSIDDNALDKFERGDDGAVISVNSTMEDGSFKFADFGQLPTDFYMLMDRLQAIKRNINGQPEFVRGGVTKTATRTVGELQEMKTGFQGRQDRKIDRLETHCENIARHMMAHLKGNFDFDQTVKIVGVDPEVVKEELGDLYDPVNNTVTFSPEDIKGEYDIEIKSGSTLPLDKTNRVRVLETVLETVAQAASQGSINPFMKTLVELILQDYDIKGLDEAYKLEVQMAEEAKQSQNQQMDVKDQKDQADTQKRMSQSRLIDADAIIKEQEAQVGPVGRAQLTQMEKQQGTAGQL